MKELFKKDRGYVLISTLFFLMLSGLFSHSVIQISSSYLLQLRQLSTAYEGKAALNMSKSLLQQELENNHFPTSGSVQTSAGTVKIAGTKDSEQMIYHFTLTKGNGETYQKEVVWPLPQLEE